MKIYFLFGFIVLGIISPELRIKATSEEVPTTPPSKISETFDLNKMILTLRNGKEAAADTSKMSEDDVMELMKNYLKQLDQQKSNSYHISVKKVKVDIKNGEIKSSKTKRVRREALSEKGTLQFLADAIFKHDKTGHRTAYEVVDEEDDSNNFLLMEK